MSKGNFRKASVLAWVLIGCAAVRFGGVQFVLPRVQPRSSVTRINSLKIQDLIPSGPEEKDDMPSPDTILPKDINVISLGLAAGAIMMVFGAGSPALATQNNSKLFGLPSFNSTCDVRKPVVGEQVRNETGLVLAKDKFKLKRSGIAAVSAVNEDGDFKLRNKAGVISDWLCRKDFKYLGSKV